MKLKGSSLLCLLIGVAIIFILTGFFRRFFNLMINSYNQISVYTDLQRDLRKIGAKMIPEIWEACPASGGSQIFLQPTGLSPSSAILRFSHPINLSNPTSPSLEVIRYEYVAADKILYRQVEGSGINAPLCRNLSSVTFTWMTPRYVKMNITAFRQIFGVNLQQTTISATGELYMGANYYGKWVSWVKSPQSAATEGRSAFPAYKPSQDFRVFHLKQKGVKAN